MKIKWKEKEGEYLTHVCTGCDEEHLIPMWGSKPWEFNNDFEKPTLSPSVKHTIKRADVTKICHYFIKEGNIQYCSDCHHALAGKTLELPEIKK